MPTSGEARIHASSSYNLRSRPLPKTKQASVANKENVGKRGVSNTRIPTRKSKLPVSSSSRKPPVSSSSGGSSGTKTSNTRVRGVPNFEKLHKNWQKKFQQGKAVTKKPCTRAHEFDLTRPGTHFKGAYYSGDDHTDTEDEFQVDQDALQSILDDRGLSNDAITGRSTVATMGGGRSNNTRAVDHRQTLGALPTHSNAYNKALSAAKTPRQAMGFSAQRNKSRKKSLVDEQQLDDLEFETDASALATILNNVGLQPVRDHNGMTRQTIASMQARPFQRNSVYYQAKGDRDITKVYEDFARQTIGGALSPTVVKIREFALSQTLPKKLAASPHHSQSNQLHRAALFNNAAASGRRTPGRGITRPKTPGTASRVLNPNIHRAQEQSCSPALRVSNQPRSALRKPNGNSHGVSGTVCWAEILNSPPDQAVPVTKDELATALFADEEVQYAAPYSMTQKRHEQLKRIEEDTSVNRHKVEEMEAVELQLQREIERLQMAEDAKSRTQTSVPTEDPAYFPQYPQLIPTPQPSLVASQPQYIGQPAPVQQPMQTMRTMPQNVSNLGQNPLQVPNFGQVEQSFYSSQTVSQSYPVSSRIANPPTRPGLYQTTLPGASRYDAPSYNMDVLQQNIQPPQTSSIQKQTILTSGPLQRPLVNSSSDIGYKFHVSHNLAQSMSESGSNLIAENQKLITPTIVSQLGFTDSSRKMVQPATSLPHTGQVMNSRLAHQNAMLQYGGINGTISSATDGLSRRYESQLQASSLPSWTSGSSSTLQTSTVQGGLSTVYGMPADLVRKDTSHTVVSALPSGPLTSAFAGGSPVQPVIKSTIQPKSAVIQTPLPVKPEHHFKHKVMKQYTPAVQSTQRPIMDIPIPIQTPMAMRNSTLQSGVKGRLVSPVPQIATLQTRNNESQDFSNEYNLSTASLEPKLKLDFDGVEDTPSVSHMSSVPGVNGNMGTTNHAASVSTSYPSVNQGLQSNEQSIDLLTPGMRLKGQWNKNVAGQLFHDTLLDEECALYTCRLQSKFLPKPVLDRNHNPVAKVLMEGDDMHFVPISDELPSTNTGRMLAGSAFNTYASWS